MDNPGYISLSRQSGLMREMRVVANNIANLSTTGFRSEGVVFAEHVRGVGAGAPSVSIASASGHSISMQQGALEQTGGVFDFAIEGEGFFLLQTASGEALTRAGRFLRTPDGELATPDGDLLLDGGGAPVFVPPQAREVTLAEDGTLSADGRPLTQIGLWMPVDPTDLERRAGVMFDAPGGIAPAADTRLMQGMLEASNVNAITQIARMIEVQRAYELGQSFLDAEDGRVRDFLRTIGARS